MQTDMSCVPPTATRMGISVADRPIWQAAKSGTTFR